MRKFRILIMLLFFSGSIYCQYDTDDIMPSSPSVCELGKYGSMPISYYSGTPQIDIPLYNYKVGDFSMPLSFSYHASGIKVDAVAPWVGLGWSLNAGGVISIQIKNRSDFNKDRVDIANFEDIENQIMPTEQEISSMTAHPSDGGMDSEPDIYNFNFCGYSGQFVFDEEFNAHFLNDKGNLKVSIENIEYETVIIDGQVVELSKAIHAEILIIDNNGIKYYFEENEFTKSYLKEFVYSGNTFSFNYSYNDLPINITALFLSRIVLPNGIDVITIEYRDEIVKYETRINGKLQTEDNNSQKWELFPAYNEAFFSSSFVQNNTKKIEKIKNNRTDLEVCFNNNLENGGYPNRIDIKYTYPLYNIYIKEDGNEIFHWDFDYDYFSSNLGKYLPSTWNPSVAQSNPLHKRLKLKNIQKVSIRGDKSVPYTFDYFGEEEEEDDLRLPYRNCYAGIDNWGYCNANITDEANANDALKSFPYFTGGGGEMRYVDLWNIYYGQRLGGYTSSKSMYLPSLYEGHNRTPSNIYVKSNSLKTIHYPTGGKTTFEYEGHTYGQIGNSTQTGVCGGQRIKTINDFDNKGGIVTRTFDYGYNGVLLTKPYFCYENIDPALGYSLTKSYNLLTSPYNTLNSLDGQYIGYKMVVETNENGSTTYKYHAINDFPDTFETMFVYMGDCDYPSTFAYGLIRHNGNFPSIYPFFNGSVGKSYGRGLLKDIIKKNINNVKVYEENFIYEFNDKSKVYGNEGKKHLTFHEDDCYGHIGALGYSFNSYYIQTGESYLTEKTIINYDPNGQNVVEEYHYYSYDKNTRQLVKEFVETSDNKHLVKTYLYPNHYSYQNCIQGKLDCDESNYQLLETLLSELELCEQTCNTECTTAFNQCLAQNYDPLISDYNSCQNSCNDLSLVSECNGLLNQIWYGTLPGAFFDYHLNCSDCCMDHYLDPANQKFSECAYEANNCENVCGCTQDYYNQLNTNWVDCDESYIQCLLDNLQYSNSDVSAIVKLALRNQISRPIEEQSWEMDEEGNYYLLSASLTLFNEFEPGLILPYNILSFESDEKVLSDNYIHTNFIENGNTFELEIDSRFQSRMNFDEYDSYGNILQYHKTNDIDMSYIWGYHLSQPIASGINANRNEIAYTSFESEYGSGSSEFYDWYCSGNSSIFDEGAIGNKSLMPCASPIYSSYSIPTGQYRLSMYLRKASLSSGSSAVVTVSGQSIEPFWGYDNWTFNERIITLTESQQIELNPNDNTLIDEIKLCPIDAQLTTYTYDPLIGITSATNPDHTSTYFDYDGFGRLQNINNDDGNVQQYFEYNYGEQQNLADLVLNSTFSHQYYSNGPTISYEPGEQIYLSCQYLNRGGNSSIGDQFRIAYYISNDMKYSTNDLAIGLNPSVSLDVYSTGNTFDHEEYLNIPSNATPGDWYIIYRLDRDNHIFESHEENNYRAVPIIIE